MLPATILPGPLAGASPWLRIMYSRCIFCSADLGSNEIVETFPVGARLAFDAWKGRLWCICPSCSRWNLAPIEERWEAVEEAEKHFRDCRTRVQSENVGLARMPDGTRLVRVGEALPGELAAWRYGETLRGRRRHLALWTGAAVAAGAAFVAGAPALIAVGAPVSLFTSVLNIGNLAWQRRHTRRVIHRLPAAASPTGEPLLIRRHHLFDASLEAGEDGPVLHLPSAAETRRSRPRLTMLGATPYVTLGRTGGDPPPLDLRGESARRVLARAMTDYNWRGGTAADVARALSLLERAGGAESYLRETAGREFVIASDPWRRRRAAGGAYSLRQIAGTFRGEILPVRKYRGLGGDTRPRLDRPSALAFEMALHEEAERRALESELAELEAAWEEAEEIAAIADSLPFDPLERFGRKLGLRP